MTEQIKGLNQKWLLDHSAETSVDGSALVLIQGYPSTGFGSIHAGEIDFRLRPEIRNIEDHEWEYYFDIRMFGQRGEWHCWRVPSHGWFGRLAKRSDWRDVLDRNHVLWGTQFEKQGEWYRCIEGRGAQIWVPASLTVTDGSPPSLLVRQKVEYDDDGMAGITDAMLLEINSFVKSGSDQERPL